MKKRTAFKTHFIKKSHGILKDTPTIKTGKIIIRILFYLTNFFT